MPILQPTSWAGICGGNSDFIGHPAVFGGVPLNCFEPSHKRMKEKDKSKRRGLT